MATEQEMVVDILKEGLMLKFNIQNLKRDFQNILDSVNSQKATDTCNMSTKNDFASVNSLYGLLENPHYYTPVIKQCKNDVLVDSDFNHRVTSDPQVLIVSDRPLSQATDITPHKRASRSVYRSHKKRLMARRESGDGAPADKLPNRQQFQSKSRIPSMSPVRRLPIKQQLSTAGSPIVSRVCRSLKPKFQSEEVVPCNEPRPSPEGLGCEPLRNTLTPTRSFKKSLPMVEKDNEVMCGQITRTPKKTNPRRAKKHFPKTPKSGRKLANLLDIIDENQVTEVRKHPGQFERFRCNNELYHSPVSNTQSEVKLSTANLKDISQISNYSKTSFREQPSNMNCLEHLQASFAYPLHSTMSYPLHSTMHNAHQNISDEAELSIIGSDDKQLNDSNGTSSSGVSLSDSDKATLTKSVSTCKKQSKYMSVSATQGVNMDRFSCDEGIMSDSSDDDSFFGIKVPGPVDTQQAVDKFYSLTPKPIVPESDCDSSVLSVSVDEPAEVRPTGYRDHVNIVTCRCHVHQVHKLRRNLATSHRRTDLVESALFLESQYSENKHFSKRSHQSHRSSNKKSHSQMTTVCCGSQHIDSDCFCHSIESMTSIHPLVAEDVCVRNSRSNVVAVRPAPVNTNCINLGRMLKAPSDTTMDQTLNSDNVTMVAKGCMGFLKKKSKSKKSEKKTPVFDDEDKENVPHRSSYLMDRDTKKRLSKRMKDFRETTFTDPRKMVYQTMGHL